MWFLYNPHAGKSAIKGKLSDILEVFTQGGYEITVRPTTKGGELPQLLAQRAGEFDLVVCSGGDGTLNEAVNGLMRCEAPPRLGYIPAGTVNDFASSFCIPRDMVEAARGIVKGISIGFDVASFGEERYFAYVAAFGAFTDVSYETPQQIKNWFGRAAYFLEGMRLKHLTQYRPYQLRLEYDGGVMEGNYLLGMVTNATSVGGRSFSESWNVTMNDGLLETAFIQMPQNALELQQIVNALISQSVENCPLVHVLKTSRLKVYSDVSIPWTLDGEYGGSPKTVEIQCRTEALRLVTDASEPELLPVDWNKE